MLRTGHALAALACCAALGGVSSAIAAMGSVSGRVTDEEGRAVVAAHITLTGPGAVGIIEATTNHDGLYRFPAVPLRETLVIRADAPGIVPVVYEGVLARDGSGTRRDFILRNKGSRDWLIVLDARIPYHAQARDAILEELQSNARVLELRGVELEDARLLREAASTLPSAVIAIGGDAARLAGRWVKDAPVVYTMVVDPVAENLKSANLCGVRMNAGFDEQLSALLAARPGARTIATIFDPRTLNRVVGELRDAADRHGLSLVAKPARGPDDIPDALASLSLESLDAFLLLLDPFLIDAGSFDAIRRFTHAANMIFVVPDRSLVAAGGTFSYAPGFAQMGVQAAELAEMIVRGSLTPAQIGAIYPTTRYFSLNPDEAYRLGIPLSPRLFVEPSVRAN